MAITLSEAEMREALQALTPLAERIRSNMKPKGADAQLPEGLDNLANEVCGFIVMLQNGFARYGRDYFISDDAEAVYEGDDQKRPSPLGGEVRGMLVQQLMQTTNAMTRGRYGDLLVAINDALEALKPLVPSWQIKPHWVRSTIPFGSN